MDLNSDLTSGFLCVILTGPCLHYQLSEERDALGLWKREQEEGADQQPGRDLQPDRERASDFSWRFPQPQENAGTRLHTGPRDGLTPAHWTVSHQPMGRSHTSPQDGLTLTHGTAV